MLQAGAWAMQSVWPPCTERWESSDDLAACVPAFGLRDHQDAVILARSLSGTRVAGAGALPFALVDPTDLTLSPPAFASALAGMATFKIRTAAVVAINMPCRTFIIVRLAGVTRMPCGNRDVVASDDEVPGRRTDWAASAGALNQREYESIVTLLPSCRVSRVHALG